jgi:Yersinia/Haemophilus virulence surface antigen
MGWAENIQKPVNAHGGETLVLYNQALDNRAKSGTYASGWCFAMAVYWIIKDAANGSFWEWFGPPAQACPTLSNRNACGAVGPVYVALDNLMKTDKKAADAMKAGILAPQVVLAWFAPKVEFDSKQQCVRNRAGDTIQFGQHTGDFVGAMLTGVPGYKLLSAYGANAAHAMAARVVDGNVVYMDPNYGEFWFPGVAPFKGFMDTYWRASGYAGRFSMLTAVTAFTDPHGMILRG